jgi:hypothetical protein
MQDAVKELGSLLQAKSLAVQELTRKVEVLRDTLDCTYTGKVLAKPNQSHARIHPSFLRFQFLFYFWGLQRTSSLRKCRARLEKGQINIMLKAMP